MCVFPARSPIRPSSTVCARRFPTRSLRMLMPRPKPASCSTSTTVWPAFRAIISARNGVAMKIVDNTLRIRSPGAAKGYLGGEPLLDAAGFVDSGDIIERHGERFYFAGRKGGIINVGGLKVHPEEIEAVINRHPSVRMSLVQGRQNPVTGSIVVADVVLKGDEQAPDKSP